MQRSTAAAPEVDADSYAESILTQIRVVMAAKRLRQTDVATRMGKKLDWLSSRMVGRVQLTVNDVALIAAGLEVEPDVLWSPDHNPYLRGPIPA